MARIEWSEIIWLWEKCYKILFLVLLFGRFALRFLFGVRFCLRVIVRYYSTEDIYIESGKSADQTIQLENVAASYGT